MSAFYKTHTHHVPLWGSLCTLLLTLGCYFIPSAKAAERLILQIGPYEQSVTIEDLEQFAYTGQIPPSLSTYRFLLTSQVREMLLRRLHIDPSLAEQFLDELFSSEDGERLIEQIKTALPDVSQGNIKASLTETLQQPEDFSILNFLAAYPTDTLRINLVASAAIATQFGSANLQSKMLSPELAKALKVNTEFKSFSNLDPTAEGKQEVYKETLILEDEARKRRIPVDIYYSFKSQGPLVIMSHGFAADRRFLRYLAYHLASYGLTVVSVEHPGSSIYSLMQMPQGAKLSQILPASEFIDRPKDISFVLDQLEKLNQHDSYFKGKFQTKQVSIIGHSFGGYTALALAGAKLNPKQLRSFCQDLTPLGRSPADWLQCSVSELPYSEIDFKDTRIVQVIALNPIVGNLFSNGLSQINIPTLILASGDDGITPNIAHQLQPFKQLQGEKYLMVALGATHMSVTDICYLSSAMGQSTLVREVMNEEANPLRNALGGVSLAFIQQLTPQAQDYQPFLNPAYVQSLSSPNISLLFTTKLPFKLDVWLNVLSASNQKLTMNPSKPKPSIFNRVKGFLADLKDVVSPQQYQIGELEQIFGSLVRTYDQKSKNWG